MPLYLPASFCTTPPVYWHYNALSSALSLSCFSCLKHWLGLISGTGDCWAGLWRQGTWHCLPGAWRQPSLCRPSLAALPSHALSGVDGVSTNRLLTCAYSIQVAGWLRAEVVRWTLFSPTSSTPSRPSLVLSRSSALLASRPCYADKRGTLHLQLPYALRVISPTCAAFSAF